MNPKLFVAVAGVVATIIAAITYFIKKKRNDYY